MQNRLKSLTLRGFKSIRELRDFQPGNRVVLIGPNGAGKSNLISFFRMLGHALGARDGLQTFVSMTGGASSYLFDGPSVTREIDVEVALETTKGLNKYAFRLALAANDRFVFLEEKYLFIPGNVSEESARWSDLDVGHKEPKLVEHADLVNSETPRVLLNLLKKIRVHQFHNTSQSSRLRIGNYYATDDRHLKEDGANLAAILLRLRSEEPGCYRRIVETIHAALPFFDDFELEQTGATIALRWRERGSDRIFDASEASDGMLRFFALVTLLRQPAVTLPSVLILDEPELGLHPVAIEIVGSLIRTASRDCQVIVATQSPSFVDQFDPEDVVVVDRENRETKFRRLDKSGLENWLEVYSTSELWEKNLLGGLP